MLKQNGSNVARCSEVLTRNVAAVGVRLGYVECGWLKLEGACCGVSSLARALDA